MTVYGELVRLKSEVPSCYHQSYIQTGYRPINRSILTCIKSAFWPTNEMLNFWTHFISLILMVSRTVRIMINFENKFEVVKFPFYIHSFGTCYLLLVSSIAHLFCCYSERCCQRCFSVDQAAVVLYAICVLLGFDHLACPMSCYGIFSGVTRETYLTGIVILTVLHTSFSLFTLKAPHLAAWRTMPCILMTILIVLPCIIRYTNDADDPKCFPLADKSFDQFAAMCFLAQVFFIALGGIFFATYLPERFYPGTFDIVGQSHQLFHICVSLSMYFQSLLIENGLNKASEQPTVSRNNLSVTWACTVGVFSLVFVLTHTTVLLHDRTRPNTVKITKIT